MYTNLLSGCDPAKALREAVHSLEELNRQEPRLKLCPHILDREWYSRRIDVDQPTQSSARSSKEVCYLNDRHGGHRTPRDRPG